MKRMVIVLMVLMMLAGMTTVAGAQGAEDMNENTIEFSLRLFNAALDSGDTNVVISPVSSYLALSLAAAGAGSDTLNEFQVLLGADGDALSQYCASLSNRLMDTRESTKMMIANAGWVDERFQMDPAYMERIISGMKAEVFERDLDTEDTRREINDWVSGKTAGLIPSLLDKNLQKETVLALINTLYFKARWLDPFEANSTKEQKFYREDGSSVAVQFMNEWRCDRDYIQTDGAEGILRPYDDGKTAFLALRATDGRSVKELAGSLTPDILKRYIQSAKETYLTLSMPRFTLDYGMDMNLALIQLGLKQAFNLDLADFTPMGKSEYGNIFLSRVLQKVRIGVNEEGTEAAAATVVEMMAGSAMPVKEPVVLNLNSPFVYAVLDIPSGIPLFIGCMDDPSRS